MTRLSGHDVMRAVAAHYGLSAEDLSGSCRQRHVARPRQVAMYAMRHLCPHLSTPVIGRILGGLNHTTVLYGASNIARLVESDPDVREEVRDALQVVAALDRSHSATAPSAEFVALLPFDVLCAGFARSMQERSA